MISQKGLNDLATDYRRALKHVNNAASILEDASIIAVDVTGQFGQTASASLITALNEIYTNINTAINQIRATRPTD